jgi:hypothetical protein
MLRAGKTNESNHFEIADSNSAGNSPESGDCDARQDLA